MFARSLLEIVEPGSTAGSVMQDFKVIGLATQHIGAHVYEGVLTFLGIGEGLQYLAVIAAVYLFVLDRTNWRTNLLTALLVPYIFLNLPSFLLDFMRGEIGYWVAFVALVIKLFFPKYIPEHTELPASLILLLVTAPSLVVGLRFNLYGQLISIGIGSYLIYEHVYKSGGVRESVSQRGAPITIGIVVLFVAPIAGFFL
jgi:hypothetical protein